MPEQATLGPCDFTVGGETLHVTPPLPDQPAYEYCIQRANGAGATLVGKLTYDVMADPKRRLILRVDSRHARQVMFNEPFPALADLQGLVDGKRSSRMGNISIAKGIVCDLDEKGSAPEGITVTVHKFGAVPAALQNPVYTAAVPIEWKDVRIGVFPWMPVDSEGRVPGTAKADLLRSCRIKLDLLLTSYLEEVAAEFSDIEHYSSRIVTFERLKRVEDILAGSVNTKIEEILRHAEKQLDSVLHPLASEAWGKFSLMIMSAAFARVLALHMVNVLYRCLGVADRTEKYSAAWGELTVRLRSLYGPGNFDQLAAPGTNTDLDLLRRTHMVFAGAMGNGYDPLIQSAQSRLWLTSFVRFARFVDLIRKEDRSPGLPRLFVSSQHQLPAAQAFVGAVDAHVRLRNEIQGSPVAEVAQVAQQIDAAHLKRLIKARIWNSEAVVSVIPREWDAQVHGGGKSLKWIASETDHGLFLRRAVQMFVEESTDREGVRKEFQSDFELLSPATGRLGADERRAILRERFDEHINDSFQYHGGAPDLSRGLDHTIENARRSVGTDLVLGFLSQFSAADQRTIGRVLRHARFRMKKPELARKIAQDLVSRPTDRQVYEAAKEFSRVWNNVRKRALKIGGEELPLIVQERAQFYRENLRNILEKLRPELSIRDIENWHRQIVDYILAG